jgi:hypothetical protein
MVLIVMGHPLVEVLLYARTPVVCISAWLPRFERILTAQQAVAER